jgi:hypothetical protein
MRPNVAEQGDRAKFERRFCAFAAQEHQMRPRLINNQTLIVD